MSGAAQSPIVDAARLDAWLSTHMPGWRGPCRATKFAQGQSNPTFLLEAASGRYVLRRKPPGQLLKSAHAVDREFRVLKALGETGFPVPRVHALCEDESVIGSMFYVMDMVDGRILWDPRLPDLGDGERAAIYDEMNAGLARLHSVDFAAVGLADYGRPGNYFARQFSRWSEQYRASETETRPDMDRLIAWLGQNAPADDGQVSIVHGDWRMDNMIFAPDAPKLIAVLDWELSTLGHPFADIAYQCMQLRLPYESTFRGLGGVDRAAIGLPSEDEYVALYCKRRGIAGIDNWAYYLAFNFFRMAAILQGVLKRALDGNGSNPQRGIEMGRSIPGMARMGCDLIEAAR